LTTKVHAACDSLGNPLRFILTGGQVSDYKQALALIDGMKPKAVLADKGYDADYVVDASHAMGAMAVIPPKSNRNILRDYDKELYKERNLIERMFNKLKNFRRVATRYDKRAFTYLAFVYLAATLIWLQ
jgi:transposase